MGGDDDLAEGRVCGAGEGNTLERMVSSGFVPSVHGFRFANWFPGYRYSAVCGGMVHAALDYYHAGEAVPEDSAIPPEDSPLYQHIARRLIDSFGPLFSSPAKLVAWMHLPDATQHGVWRKTRDGIPGILERLDSGEPVPLYLIYSNAKENPDPRLNHQVLASGYRRIGEGVVELSIYDPNCPGDDSVRVRAEDVALSGGCLGVRSFQRRDGAKERTLHGFFATGHYRKKEPPQAV